MRKINILSNVSDVRIDKFLAEEINIISRSKIKESIILKNVKVNGKNVKPSFKISSGEIINIDLPSGETSLLKPEKINFKVIHEDNDIIVVNKPSNLVVHPGSGNKSGTLVNGLVYHFKKLSKINGQIRPGIIHRLDKNTTGIMIIAKNDFSHQFISHQFEKRTVSKKYVALVWGLVKEDFGKIETSIIRDNKKRTLFKTGKNGRAALTEFKVLDRFENLTFLELKPKTGRTHQIRVHMSSIGHPIFADVDYGGGIKKAKEFQPKISNYLIKLLKEINRQALHAVSISFIHPKTKMRELFTVPIPYDISKIISKLRLENEPFE